MIVDCSPLCPQSTRSPLVGSQWPGPFKLTSGLMECCWLTGSQYSGHLRIDYCDEWSNYKDGDISGLKVREGRRTRDFGQLY